MSEGSIGIIPLDFKDHNGIICLIDFILIVPTGKNKAAIEKENQAFINAIADIYSIWDKNDSK